MQFTLQLYMQSSLRYSCTICNTVYITVYTIQPVSCIYNAVYIKAAYTIPLTLQVYIQCSLHYSCLYNRVYITAVYTIELYYYSCIYNRTITAVFAIQLETT